MLYARALVLCAIVARCCTAMNNGLVRTPPLGWSELTLPNCKPAQGGGAALRGHPLRLGLLRGARRGALRSRQLCTQGLLLTPIA